MLTTISQWVQVLSSHDMVTVSLVRHYFREVKRGIQALDDEVRELNSLRTTTSVALARALKKAKENFAEQYVIYFNDDFYDFYIYVVAEFLDPRTFGMVNDFILVKELMDPLLLPSEIAIPKPPAAATKGKRKADEEFTSAAQRYLAANEMKSPFDIEFNAYINRMVTMGLDNQLATEPLLFWHNNAQVHPILGRMARQVLSCGPTECSCEELFSVAGQIDSELRCNLSTQHVEEQTCNFFWKREELQYFDKKKTGRLQNSKKFASLSISLQLMPPELNDLDLEEEENATMDKASSIKKSRREKANERAKLLKARNDGREEAQAEARLTTTANGSRNEP